MIHRTPPPSIATSEPWKDDIFSRREEGQILGRLIAGSENQSATISLLAPWGSGKSVFLKRFVAHMNAEFRMKSIVIDAWKSDHHGDPLTPMLSQLMDAIEEARNEEGILPGSVDRAITAIANVAPKFILPTVSLLADLVAPGAGAATANATTLAQNALDSQRERTKAEPDFSAALELARDALTRRKVNGPMRTLLFVVDELDRCRPDYAIHMLERIKHYFDVPGIVFVVATDHGNLPSAVKTVYGPHVNGEEYLRKFFDYEFHLRQASRPALARYLMDRMFDPAIPATAPPVLEHQPGNFRILQGDSIEHLDKYEYLSYFSELSEHFNLSARDQIQAFTILKAFKSTRAKDAITLPLIDCFIACLRFGCNGAFLHLSQGKLDTLFDEHEWKTKNIVLGSFHGAINLFLSWKLQPPRNRSLRYEFDDLQDRATAKGSRGSAELRTCSAFLARMILLPSEFKPSLYVQQVIRLSDAITGS